MGKNRKVAKPEPKRKVDICRHVLLLLFHLLTFWIFAECFSLGWCVWKLHKHHQQTKKERKSWKVNYGALIRSPKRKVKGRKRFGFPLLLFLSRCLSRCPSSLGSVVTGGGNAVHPRCHPQIFLLVLPRSWTESTKVLSHSFRSILKKMRAS